MRRGAYYRHGGRQKWTNLYRVREAAGLTQREAAEALGVSERTYRAREAVPQFVVTPAIVAAFRAIATNPARFDRDVAAFAEIISEKPAKGAAA